MRKETEKVVTAFIEGRPAAAARTCTDGKVLLLHGNRIAWKVDGRYYASLCGWPTNTTRDRLNAVARMIGAGWFSQMNHKQYYRDREIGDWDTIELIPEGK